MKAITYRIRKHFVNTKILILLFYVKGFTRKKTAGISIKYEYSLSSKRLEDNISISEKEPSYDWKTLLYHQMVLKKGMLGPEVSTATPSEMTENISKITGNEITDPEIFTKSPEVTEIRQPEVETNTAAGIVKEKEIPRFIPEKNNQNVDRLGLLVETSGKIFQG